MYIVFCVVCQSEEKRRMGEEAALDEERKRRTKEEKDVAEAAKEYEAVCFIIKHAWSFLLNKNGLTTIYIIWLYRTVTW